MGAIIIFPIKFVTEMDYDAYKEFYKFNSFKRRGYKVVRYIIFLPFILMIPIGIYTMILKVNVVIPITMLFIAAMAFLYIGDLFFILPKSVYKRMPSYNKAPQNFEIFEDRFYTDRSEKDIKETIEIYYSMLYIVYETSEAFYLFAEKDWAFLIPKKCLTNEQSNLLSDLFRSRLDSDKYKVCCKKQIRDKKN